MKFSFKIQPYQTDAVKSITSVFNGQPHNEKASYIRDINKSNNVMHIQMELNNNDDIDLLTETGYKNESIKLTDGQLLENIKEIQRENNIHVSDNLVKAQGKCSLDIEMETGTGKTYVYIKTMFELNKLYGWSKFIVVVPSIAIREGVKKSFEMTQEHFMDLYGKKARYFIYNSSNLNQLDNFSSSSGINVMIINTQAFASSLKEEGRSKEARIIYSQRDEFGSRKPIDVIAANNPILILDEPQKMGKEDSATQKALKRFNPLFSLNYSATHKKQHNLVYVLDALDAFNKKLVKKIEVKGFEVKNIAGTNQYLYFDSIILSQKNPPMAKMEIEVAQSNKHVRKTFTLKTGDDLYKKSNEMEEYKNGFKISSIDPVSGTVTFTNGSELHQGEVVDDGKANDDDMRRLQIRETIVSHFEKEEKLFTKGIKTLSLFFIDEVSKYRQYDDDGNEILGEYGRIFEEEYENILNERVNMAEPQYKNYLKGIAVSDTHKGYFSIDKKGHAINSPLKRGSEFSDDISAYDLILKNKERLLSFEEPTRFIFSHSALREGWDNPNIFQICTLKHSNSSIQKRQEVGRGLRLSVDKYGNRMDVETVGESVHDINKLTVIASESYKEYVSGLQSDIRNVLYDRPAIASSEYFKGKFIKINGKTIVIDNTVADKIEFYLIKNGYVDDERKITEKYSSDLEMDQLATLPVEIEPMAQGIHALIQSVFDESALERMIDNGKQTKIENSLNENFYKKEFQNLWKYINHKYAYTVSFDSEELINKAIKAINSELFVSQLTYVISQGEQQDEMDASTLEHGEAFKTAKTKNQRIGEPDISKVKYDLIGKVAGGAKLTRRSTATILKSIGKDKFEMFKTNPEEFVSKVINLISEQKASMIIEHVTYNQIEGEYDSSIFTAEKTTQSYDKAFKGKKHILDYVFTDGLAEKSVERQFAESLDDANEVCVYAKLPKGFHIPTPVGNYSPDWAIAFNKGTVKHIYFIAETKGTMNSLDIRPIEKAKIDCAKKLFNVLSTNEVRYAHVDSYQNLLNIMDSID